ncbi:MAG: DUF4097 family beta strand repeat-containing protein [Terracidiphilus sp.]|jgi:DUF4097 and DUF4098 domain-containing protein YvlB
MSTTPPNMPPNVPPPYPPYDHKSQWRIYREQQKAAWRAQRDAWKAQQRAMKANYTGIYGPRVPSVVGPVVLIGVGIVALLLMTGRINAVQFWSWYGHWWPLLLIGAGLALLGEWALDMKRGVPVRRGGSFIGLLIVLAIVGSGAAGWDHARPWFSQWGDHDNDFFNSFGLPEHEFDQPLLNAQIPANAAIEIDNPRGDVSVTAGDGSAISVQGHEVAYASSDTDAKKIFDTEAAHLKVSGSAVLINSEQNSSGRLNLTVTVPKNAHVTINSIKGDVTAAGLSAGINIAARGDVHLSAIAGSVEARFSDGDHDFSAHDVQGDLTADGNLNDITLSEVKGKVTQNGEIRGDVHMESVRGPVHLHTSVTDLEVAELPGDLTLNSDDLHVNQAKGQVRVVTHSEDIDLSQIYGDTYVETRDGRITIELAGNYAVDAKNSKGDVELTLPPNASANVDVRTRNGDIVSDFASPSFEGGENKAATFRIGPGGPKIVLSAENGDVHIKKGTGFPPAPSIESPAAPKAPEVNGAPHLKAPKALPAKPVTQ